MQPADVLIKKDHMQKTDANLQTGNELFNKWHQFVCGLFTILSRCYVIFLAAWSPKPSKSFCSWKAMQCPFWINIIEPLILHQQLHYWLIEGSGEEQTCNKCSLIKQLEDCAESTRAAAQQPTWIIIARHLSTSTQKNAQHKQTSKSS